MARDYFDEFKSKFKKKKVVKKQQPSSVSVKKSIQQAQERGQKQTKSTNVKAQQSYENTRTSSVSGRSAASSRHVQDQRTPSQAYRDRVNQKSYGTTQPTRRASSPTSSNANRTRNTPATAAEMRRQNLGSTLEKNKDPLGINKSKTPATAKEMMAQRNKAQDTSAQKKSQDISPLAMGRQQEGSTASKTAQWKKTQAEIKKKNAAEWEQVKNKSKEEQQKWFTQKAKEAQWRHDPEATETLRKFNEGELAWKDASAHQKKDILNKKLSENAEHSAKAMIAEWKGLYERAGRAVTSKPTYGITDEQREEAIKKSEARTKKIKEKIDKEQQLSALTEEGLPGWGKGLLGGQRIIIEQLPGAIATAATGGAALVSNPVLGHVTAGIADIYLRTYEANRGNVLNKWKQERKNLEESGDFTKEELDDMEKSMERKDFLNALGQAFFEGRSEGISDGAGTLAGTITGGKGLIKTGKGISGIVKSYLGENFEEDVNGIAGAWWSNLIYGNEFQDLNDEQVRRSNIKTAENFWSDIESEEDLNARLAAVNSKDFVLGIKDSYEESGLPSTVAAMLANHTKSLILAKAEGDEDKVEAANNAIVDIINANGGDVREHYTMEEALKIRRDMAFSIGLQAGPSAVMTRQMGNQIKSQQGMEYVSQMADYVKKYNESESASAAAIKDSIDDGKDVSGTSVYDISGKAAETIEQNIERQEAKKDVAVKGMARNGYHIDPVQYNEDGSYDIVGPETNRRFEDIKEEAKEKIRPSMQELNMDEETLDLAGEIAASQLVGSITVNEIDQLIENPEMQTAFELATGIDMNSFVVRDRKGKINQVKTNIAIQEGLLSEAADNYVESARLEQEAWNDEARGEVQKAMSESLHQTMSQEEISNGEGRGDVATAKAIGTVDPRDRTKFMFMATAAPRVYNDARYKNAEWDDVKGEYKEIYKGLDQSALKGVFEAAKEDKQIAENKNYGKPVKAGDPMSKNSLQDVGPVRVPGKVIDLRTDAESNKLSNNMFFYKTAVTFGSNITLVSDLYLKDTNGRVIYSNTETGEQINEDELAALDNKEQELYVPVQVEGAQDSNGIILNTNEGIERNIEDIAKHETIHEIRMNAPEEFKELARYLQDKLYSADPEAFMQIIQEKQRQYRSRDLTMEEAMEELIAEGGVNIDWDQLIADIETNPEIQSKPTFIEAIKNAFKNVIQKLRSILSSDVEITDEAREAALDQLLKLEDGYKLLVRAARAAKVDQANQAINDWQDEVNAQSGSTERFSISEVDSEGHKLSEGQRNYFKDSKAVDDDGNLIVFYHGTPSFGFTEFDGDGIFFTDNKDAADSYTYGDESGIYSVYLNLSNPMIIDAEGQNWDDIRAYMSESSSNRAKEINDRLDEIRDDWRNGTDNGEYEMLLDELDELEDEASGGDTESWINTAKENGHDGLIIRNLYDYGSEYEGEEYEPFTEAIAFERNQIKNIDNLNPTENDDIRYSISAQQDTDYMNAVESGDMETAQRMVDEAAKASGGYTENGNIVHLFHGTNAFGFTEFDLSKTDDGISIFLTSDKKTATTYSGTDNQRSISEKSDVKLDTYEEIEEALNKYDPNKDYAESEYKYYDSEAIKQFIQDTNNELSVFIEEMNDLLNNHSDIMSKEDIERFETMREQAKNDDPLLITNLWFSSPEYAGKHAEDYQRYYDAINMITDPLELEKHLRLREKLNEDWHPEGLFIESQLNGYSYEVISPETAKGMAEQFTGSGIYDLYTTFSNPLVIDNKENDNWNSIRVPKELQQDMWDFFGHQFSATRTRNYAQYAKAKGYDGVIFKGIRDNGGRNYGTNEVSGDVFIVFNPNEVKSADPVTYDDNGNVIPLSQRFNMENPDIRYSISDTMSVLEDNFNEYKEDKQNLRIATAALDDLQRSRYSLDSSDVSGRWDGGVQVRTTGKGITTSLINEGRLDFRGQTVKSPEDLAKLCQVLRDPRFETFRVVLTKGDKIVSFRSISSRLPGLSRAFETDDLKDSIEIVRDRMNRLGADGYYLIHNHPSGNVNASFEDLSVTRAYLALLGQDTYKGHIILDHDEYGFIDAAIPQQIHGENFPTPRIEPITGQQTIDFLHEPEIDHPVLGSKIKNSQDVANIAQTINTSDGVSVLLYTSSQSKVRGIQEISNKALKNNKEISGYIRNQAIEEFGTPAAFLYTTDLDTYNRGKELISEGVLMDAVIGYGFKTQDGGLIESGRANVSEVGETGHLGLDEEGFNKRTKVFESASGLQEYDAIRYSITPKMDADYMDAVNNGNMEEAQKLVDEAAKAAMPNTKTPGLWLHGTENEFTVFDFSQGGKNGTAEGFGIYLARDRDVSEHYGKLMIEGYVNIEKPASSRAKTINKSTLKKLIKATVEQEANRLAEDYDNDVEAAKRDTWISNYAYTYDKSLDASISEVADSILEMNFSDMEIVQEVMAGMAIRDYDEAVEFYDLLTDITGFDGFTTTWENKALEGTRDIALAFRSNQIKSADTVTYAEDGSIIPLSERFNPENDDIRYSLPTQSSQGNFLSDGQMEYFKNSQARDEQGRLLRLYHGTQNGGFTIFDPSYGISSRAFFFTNSLASAKGYSGTDAEFTPDMAGEEDIRVNYPVYLDMQNPLIVDAEGHAWVDIPFDGDYVSSNWLVEYAQSEGYDSVIIKNVIDRGSADTELTSQDDYIVFNSNQVKDVNNLNPTENPDIRYSITPEDEVKSRMAYEAAEDDSIEILEYYEQRLANLTDEEAENIAIRDYDEDDAALFYSALRSEEPVPYEDYVLEEDRIRMARSKDDFFSNVNAKWNDRWTTEPGGVLDVKSVKTDVRNLIMGVMQNSDTDSKYKRSLVNKTLMDVRYAYEFFKKDRPELASALLYHSAQRMIDNVQFYVDGTFDQYKELKHYLRNTKISIGEEYWADVEYDSFRKRNYNRINLVKGKTNVDQVYQELEELFPEFFDSEETMDVPSQLLQMEYVLDSVQPYKEAYSSEAAAELAFDIADDLYEIMVNGDEVRSLADTYKERYDAKTKAMKQRHAEAMLTYRKLRDAEIAELGSYYQQELEKQKDVSEEEIRQLREDYEQKLRTEGRKADFEIALLKENRAFVIGKLRAEKWNAVRRERERIRRRRTESKERQQEAKLHTKHFDRINENYKWLKERLLTNTKDKHIPEQYKKELAGLLAAFDLQTVGSKKLEAKRGYQSQKTIQMSALRTGFEAMHEAYPTFFIHDAIMDKMKELAKKVDGKTIDALDVEQIAEIDDILKGIKSDFTNYDKIFVRGKRMAAADPGKAQAKIALEHAEKFGPGTDYQNAPGVIDKIINLDEMTAPYFFRRIDPNKEGLGMMYGEIRRAFDKYVRNQNELNGWMDDIVGKYHQKGILWNKYGSGELANWRSENYAVTFNFEGGSATLTPAQMMSIYCLAKRPQAQKHMYSDVGGIVVAPVSFNAKILSDVKKKANKALPVRLTESDVQQIVAKLTPEQVQVAEQLQELMSTKMADWGNEASMDVMGIELFKEDNYFPIKSDKASLTQELNDDQFVQAIRNFGFAKALMPEANNPIMVEDIFDVVTEHCNNMNLYNAYSKAFDDFMKVYNYKDYGDGGSNYTVQQAVAHAYSQKATTFIMTFLRDLNGNVSGRASGIEDTYNSLLGNAKKAAVFANLRVAAQQPTAITRALYVIDLKYASGIKIEKGAMKEMFEHCPIALWKSWGYYDINMGKSIEDIMMNNGKWLEDKATDLYGALDNVTWTAIWQMVKAEVKDKHPNVEIGSDEYWELCNERMSEVVDLTQVVDSPLHRSHAMRSKNFLVKTATAFMAEPTLTFNMIRDGWIRAREAKKLGNHAEASKIIGRTIAVALLQAVTVAGAAGLIDALRKKHPDKDDEDERILHLWLVNFVENLKDELKLWNKVYVLKDIASLAEGWDDRNLALQGFQKAFLGWRQLKGDPYARSSATWYENLGDGLGYIFGVPVKTMRTGIKNAMDMFGVTSPIIDATKERLDSIADNMKDRDTKSTIVGMLASDDIKIEGNGVFGKLLAKADESDKKFDKKSKGKGKSKTNTKMTHDEERDALRDLEAKARENAEGLSGSELDDALWDTLSEGYTKHLDAGDLDYIEHLALIYRNCGGDENIFREKIKAKIGSAYKKTFKDNPTDEDLYAQDRMRHFMEERLGMTEEEVSAIVYKTDAARDLKVAFKINNEEYINNELSVLARAGITYEDVEKLYKNRNRMKLETYNGKYKDMLKSTGKYLFPADGIITSDFGNRNSPGGIGSTNHQGLDIAGAKGTPIQAADGGTVIMAGWYGGYGKTVQIQHDDGTVTQYSHLDWWDVNEGDTVAQGQEVGLMGNTGNSTGPHLHFGVMRNGEYVDPKDYINTNDKEWNLNA